MGNREPAQFNWDKTEPRRLIKSIAAHAFTRGRKRFYSRAKYKNLDLFVLAQVREHYANISKQLHGAAWDLSEVLADMEAEYIERGGTPRTEAELAHMIKMRANHYFYYDEKNWPEYLRHLEAYKIVVEGFVKCYPSRSFPLGLKEKKIKEQGNICANPYCNNSFDDVEPQADHMTPYSRGGETSEDNLQILCRHCNHRKGDQTQAEFLESEEKYLPKVLIPV